MSSTHITAVVNKSGYVSTFGGINDSFRVNSEHVTASNAAMFISLLSHVSNNLKTKKTVLFLLFPLRRVWNDHWLLGSHRVNYGKRFGKRGFVCLLPV